MVTVRTVLFSDQLHNKSDKEEEEKKERKKEALHRLLVLVLLKYISEFPSSDS